MKWRLTYKIIYLSTYLALFSFLLLSCNDGKRSQHTNNSNIEEDNKENDELISKELIGEHDKIHYLSNYLETQLDTIRIQYRFDLCICPKWYINETSEPIWMESEIHDSFPNTSSRDIDLKDVIVTGYFYKYKGIPVDLYSYSYLSEKYVPNARIFKVEKKL